MLLGCMSQVCIAKWSLTLHTSLVWTKEEYKNETSKILQPLLWNCAEPSLCINNHA